MDESEQALRWIIEILQAHDIPYQVCGGLAARIYGSTRALNDIDLYMPIARFDEIRPDVEAAITWGPTHETSAHWDLTYVKMRYNEQKIEIGDSEATSIFDSTAQRWIKQDIRFDQSIYVDVYGVRIPVMPKAQLIAYKAILARDVDLIDISQMQQAK